MRFFAQKAFRLFFQMLDRITLAIGFAAIVFLAYLIFHSYHTKEAFEVPAPAPLILQPIPEPPRTVAPAGPSSPNQSPPDEMPPVRLPGPGDSDPYDETYGSSDLQDNMRYPERLFSPAPTPTNTSLSVESGIAAYNQQVTAAATQNFNPDFVQNGGQFMEGIFANDTESSPNYSAY
jgi:hypothetical protein